MAGNVGIPSNTDISLLFTSIETAWNAMDFTRSELAEKMSFFRTGRRGAVETFAFSNMSSKPVELLLGADRQFADPEVFAIRINHKQIVPRKSMQIYDYQLKADVYNLIDLQNQAQSILKGARTLWETELASTINSNPLAFDNLSLFNTAHPANPLDLGLGTYSNDLPNTDLDEAGLTAALGLLGQAPDLDGQIDASRVRKVLIVVPTMQLYLKALKLVGLPVGSLIPSAGTAANTSVAATSPFMTMADMGFEVVWLPQLQDASDAASLKRWYVFNVSDSRRALVTSIVTPPVLDIEGPGTNSHIYMLKLAWRFSWHAFGGTGAGLPREGVRATAP